MFVLKIYSILGNGFKVAIALKNVPRLKISPVNEIKLLVNVKKICFF